jgi:hypothetical protein
LTFHNNDFETTPIVFKNNDGELIVYTPSQPSQRINAFLFQYSRLYRLYLGLKGLNRKEENKIAIANEIRSSLKELRDLLKEDNIELKILLFPVLKPVASWSEQEKYSRTESLKIFKELDLEYFDLLEALEKAIDAGVETQSPPGDPYHPSEQVSAYFAEALSKKGLFKFE